MPAGYMYKRVPARPEWLEVDGVQDIYSVTDCIAKDFTEWIDHWKHNGYWLFDEPSVMESIARETGIDLSSMTLFFYRIHPRQWDADRREWAHFEPSEHFEVRVRVPAEARVVGFDVVTYSLNTSAECSPLSCNGLASELSVNEHCLFDSFEAARDALETGRFQGSEPGPYRILEVNRVAE